ncbi:MAG: histidinol-phosphatase [Zhaonellaceae bacterium]|jgi:histidinol-phosphatase (PHP family)|nr:histidinol-phosphatase [Clostridia bacterium]
MKYKTDYHVHPNYSIDASPVEIKEYCNKALELGLAEICFTTHVELEPERNDIDNFVILAGQKVSVFNEFWLDKYFEEIVEAQDEYAGTLKVKAGIEIGYCPGVEKTIEKMLNNYPFDFVLGAIHCLRHIAISSMKESPVYYESRDLATLRQDYFETLEEAVATGLFDCIAHVDLYSRYGFKHYGPDIHSIHQGAIEPIFEKMARKGMGLEINTSSLRRGLKEFHPSKEIVQLAAESGIEVFTVGSDAHSLEQLGDHIDEALELLKKLNLTNHGFTKRKAYPIEAGYLPLQAASGSESGK